MQVTLDLDDKKLTEEGLRAMLLKGTIEHVIAQLTPERLETFLGETMSKMFDNLFAGYHSPLQNAVMGHAQKIVAELIVQPEVQTRIEAACKKAVDSYINQIPGDLEKVLREVSTSAIRSRLGVDRR